MSTHSEKTEITLFGFWVYLMSDVVLFAGLFAAYAVLMNATGAGPSSDEIINLPYVFVETLALLLSSFVMGLATLAARANKKALSLWLLGATLALGLSFLGMEVYEFTHLIADASGPTMSAYLSSFFALVGTHGLHVALGSIWMSVLIARIYMKGFTPGNTRKLMMLSLFWHFLDIIWIFIFTFVYLFGAL